MYYYEPESGHGLKHDPLNSIIGPRPIGWISSQDGKGRLNLAPYSFFNLFNYTPPILGFSSLGWKDSVRNIQETGEFVYNLATRELAQPMNQTSASVPPEVDEFQLAGLAAATSRRVKPPRVADSPAAMECKLLQIVQLQDLNQHPVSAWLVLGQVVGVHIHPDCIREGVYDAAAAHPILRAGRRGDYAEIRPEAMFEMLRPT